MALATDSAGFPWSRWALALVPAGVLVVAAGAAGPRTPAGLVLLGVAVATQVAAVVWWMPRLLGRAAAAGTAELAAEQFLQRALEVDRVEDVAREFVAAVHAAMGPTRAVLVAPSRDGGVRLLPEQAAPDLGDAQSAFLWLGETVEPIHRAALEVATGEGAAEARALLDRLGGEVLLPLRHRGLLLGLGVVGAPSRPLARADGFLRALRAYAAVAIANTYLDAEARGRQGLAADLGLATAVQESLMPAERPVRRERFGLRGVFRPMAECGGDLWLWRELAGEKVLVVIADATGHGAAPALLTAVAKGAIDAHWQLYSGDVDPARLLQAVNRLVYRTGRRRYLMTAFAAVIDTISGELRFANAGQNFPLVIGKTTIEPLVARGDTLGSSAEASYQTHVRQLEQGDRLLLYTDGLIDAGAPFRDPFGERRLRAALSGQGAVSASRLTDLLMKRVDEHADGHPLGDDVTVVMFELGAEPAGVAA